MASYRSVNTKKLGKIVDRLQKETVAQKASRYDFDNQECHIAYIRKRDSRALSARSKSSCGSIDLLLQRLSRPTTASEAARYNFDAQVCHIDYLKQTLQNYPPPRRAASSQEIKVISKKLTTDTAASKAAKYDFDAQREHVMYLEKTDPKYPGHKKYGFRVKSAPFYDATDADLDQMVERWRKPTVASLGGTSLLHKNFEYMKPRPSATCPEVKGVDTKFNGKKRLSTEELMSSINRLNTPHKRFMRG